MEVSIFHLTKFQIFFLRWEILRSILLLLLLSHFSHVQLCATPETAAHQAPPSLGFSRQEHWSGLPFPSPMHESEKWKSSRLVVSNCSRPRGLQPTRLPHPWDFPGKSTGVGCHCRLRRSTLIVTFKYVVQHTVLLTLVTLLYPTSPELIYLIAGCFYLLTTFTHISHPLTSPPYGNHQSILCICEFRFFF